MLKGLETAYSWEQEEEGGEAVKERGVPGGQEPEQDQEDEEEWSRQTRYSRQGSIIIFFFCRENVPNCSSGSGNWSWKPER